MFYYAGTSTRKPRLNPALVAAQAAGTATSSQKRPRSANSLKKKRRHPPRLSNVDRSSAQTREVSVTVSLQLTEAMTLAIDWIGHGDNELKFNILCYATTRTNLFTSRFTKDISMAF